MANTVQNNNRIAWGYVDNSSVTWRVSAKQVYVEHATDGAKYGGSAAASSVRAWPSSWTMRTVECTSGSTTIRVPVYAKTAALWTTPGTTLTRTLNGVDATFTSTSVLHEETYDKQAKQST
jgi:hypothetical protein